MAMNCAYAVPPSYSGGYFNMPYSLTTLDRWLTCLLKEVMLQIFITLKNPSYLAGLKPANPGSSGKHYNHYTTTDNYINNYILISNDRLYGTN
jgi:hypothetical protein